MKERIFQALKKAIVDANGKTNISDKTLNVYAERISPSITDESQIAEAIKPDVIVLKEISANISFEASEAVKNTKREKETPDKSEKKSDELNKDEPAWFTAYKKEQAEKLEKIEQANNQSKTEKAKADRDALILQKAKELKISQERIDEGFAIAEDADEAAIGSYLSKIATREVAMSLPKDSTGFTLSTSDKMLEEATIASLNSVPDVKP